MANMYFNSGAAGGGWETLGNWFMNAGFTDPAVSLPTSSDSVFLFGWPTNSGPQPTVVNLTTEANVDMDITVTGTAVFNACGVGGGYTLTNTGLATFDGGTSNGTVTGNATFTTGAQNQGTVGGNATFTTGAQNQGTVGGNATFSDNSYNYNGTVSGNATFNDYSYQNGTVGGDATFYDYAQNGNTVSGNATFNDSSWSNYGTVNGIATFNDNSYIDDGSMSDATFNDKSRMNGGTVGGNATFNDRSYVTGGSFNGGLTISGDPVMAGAALGYGGSSGYFVFSRAQLGINGSSILGVI
jgi:hypothetical protein